MNQGLKLETATIKELFQESTTGTFPVLLDIVHKGIVWTDNSNLQEIGHLRLINDTVPVKYNGKVYLPAYFSVQLPSTDGKKNGKASITISAIDQRIVEVIRSIESNPIAIIEAVFTKLNEDEIAFSHLLHYEFEMSSVSWTGTSAKWDLTFDPDSQVNIPKDLATANRCPAVNENH